MTMEEGQRREILETRAAHAKIAEMLTLGPHYCEKIEILCTDNLQHHVAVYALSSRDVQEIFEASGLDPFRLDEQNFNALPSDQKLTLMRELAVKSSHDPEILSKIAPFEELKIANKAMEISGWGGGAKSPKTESTPSP